MRDVTTIVFPGASLMEITTLDDGIRVRCPGCGHVQELRGTGDRAFQHGEGCPVYRQIRLAQSLRKGAGGAS